jgi:exodeoxyribonuclease VII small subunit
MSEKTGNEGTNSTLEEDFRKLDTLLADMEKDDIGIEEAFSKYTEGMQLIKSCNDRIDQVEKKVQQLSDDLKTEDFE